MNPEEIHQYNIKEIDKFYNNFDFKEVIKENIIWLSQMIQFRDVELGEPDKKKMIARQLIAAQYSTRLMQTLSRCNWFINQSKENLQWLHDYLLQEKVLNQDIFIIFFKLWSKKYLYFKDKNEV